MRVNHSTVTSFPVLLLFSIFFLGFLCLWANAAVIGVDYGSEYIKCSAAKNNAIDIVLNEQSHRKSSNYIGFRGEERFFSEDAKNLAPRFPDNMVTYFNRLLGVLFYKNNNKEEKKEVSADVKLLQSQMHHDFQYIANANSSSDFSSSRNTVSIHLAGETNRSFSVDELFAMMLQHIKHTAEKDAESTNQLREVVIVIPSFLTRRQSQAVIDAAAIAGLSTLSLMRSTTATAVQYGMQNRGFLDAGGKNVVIYDMGASKTDVGVYRFIPPVKGGKKPKASEGMGTIQTIAIISDPTLGGRSFDVCIAKHIQAEFEKKFPKLQKGPLREEEGETLTLSEKKSLISLMRAATKAKEVLSANKEAPITVEGIVPDKDFSTKLSRDTFEKICAPLIARAGKLVKSALDAAKTKSQSENSEAAPFSISKPEDIDHFELFGGGCRIPRVISEIKSSFEGGHIGRTLNADEAAALGAGYYAAFLSNHFHMKGFAVKELLPYDVHFELSKQQKEFEHDPTSETANPPAVQRPLFRKNQFLPSRKSITVSRVEDFDVKFYVANEEEKTAIIHNSVDDDSRSSVDSILHVTGVRAALDAVHYFSPVQVNQSHKIRVEIRASESALYDVEEVELVVKYAANVTRKVKVNDTAKNTTNISSNEEKEGKVGNATDKEDDDDDDDDGKKGKGSEEEEGKNNNHGEDDSTSNKTEKSIEEEDQQQEGTADDKNSSNNNSTAAKKDRQGKKNKKKKKTEVKYIDVTQVEMKKKTISLKFKMEYVEKPWPVSDEEAQASRQLLKKYSDMDEIKKLTAAAKNDLEAYLIWAKTDESGILQNEEMQKNLEALSGKEKKKEEGKLAEGEEEDANISNQFSELKQQIEKTSDWLEEEGSHDDITRDDYLTKLSALKSSVRKLLKNMKKLAKREEPQQQKTTETSSSSKSDEEKVEEGSEEKSSSGQKDDVPAASDAEESSQEEL